MSKRKEHDHKSNDLGEDNKTCSIVLILIWLLTFSSLALNSLEQRTRQQNLFSAAIATNIDFDHQTAKE